MFECDQIKKIQPPLFGHAAYLENKLKTAIWLSGIRLFTPDVFYLSFIRNYQKKIGSENLLLLRGSLTLARLFTFLDSSPIRNQYYWLDLTVQRPTNPSPYSDSLAYVLPICKFCAPTTCTYIHYYSFQNHSMERKYLKPDKIVHPHT